MHIYESGRKGQPTILFLHGNGASGVMWQAHMQALSEYHCLAPDFPGYGLSCGEEWTSLEDIARRLAALISERATGGRAHVIGLSLGGAAALALLAAHPEQVDRAIVDGAGVLRLPALPLMKVGFRLMQPFLHTEFVIRTIAQQTKISAEEYPSFHEGMMMMSPASFTRAFIQALEIGYPSGLKQTPAPTLLVAGEREVDAVRASGKLLAREMPHAHSCIAPGMGHGWLAEDPDLHLRMVRAWLSDAPLPEELIQ